MNTRGRWLLVLGLTFGTVALACGESSDNLNNASSSSSGGEADGAAPPATCVEGDKDCIATIKASASVAVGEESANKRQCTKCHNSPKGVMAGATEPIAVTGAPPDVKLYPPNLTPDLETGIGDGSEASDLKLRWSDDKLATTMRKGFDRDGRDLCPQMKHDSTMKDFEAYSIVKWLRSLPPVNNKVPGSICPPLKE